MLESCCCKVDIEGCIHKAMGNRLANEHKMPDSVQSAAVHVRIVTAVLKLSALVRVDLEIQALYCDIR